MSKKGKKRKTEDTTTPKGGRAKRTKSETPEPKKSRGTKPQAYPKGSWETHVASIDTIEEARDDDGTLQRFVYVLWNSGEKTRHQLNTVNEKCPQKVCST
jgi:chromobox protein 1